jgi:hypothetical protein
MFGETEEAMSRRTLAWAPLLATVAVAALLLVPGAPAQAQQRVGAATAVNPDVNGTPPGGAMRQITIGQDILHQEQVATGAAGQTQFLFLDQSSLMLGPGSDLMIDNFVFDPSSSGGRLAMTTTKGVLRYVGGALSKNENAVTMRTPAGELGIRGGVFLLSLTPQGRLDVVFLYGIGLSVTPNCAGCAPQLITRPGYFVSIAQPGAPASAPAPAPSGFVAQLLGQLNGQAGRTGGSVIPPTDAALVNSGLPSIVSGDLAASDAAALHHLPPFTPAPTFNPAVIQTSLGVNSAFSHGRVVTVPSTPVPAPPRIVTRGFFQSP